MNKLPLAVVKEFVFGEHPPRVHFHIGLQSHTSTEENFLALVKSTSTHYFSQFSFFLSTEQRTALFCDCEKSFFVYGEWKLITSVS